MLATIFRDESSEILLTVWQNALGQAKIDRRGTIILAKEFQMLSSSARARKCENQMRKIEDEKLKNLQSPTKLFLRVLL